MKQLREHVGSIENQNSQIVNMALTGMTSQMSMVPKFQHNFIGPDWLHAEHSTGVSAELISSHDGSKILPAETISSLKIDLLTDHYHGRGIRRRRCDCCRFPHNHRVRSSITNKYMSKKSLTLVPTLLTEWLTSLLAFLTRSTAAALGRRLTPKPLQTS